MKTRQKIAKVDQSAYRRLLHCLWYSPNVKKPAAIPFSKIYADTKEQKGGRNHLHNERVISELSKHVCGTLQYMMSYVSEISISNWLVYGFKVNGQCQTLVPNFGTKLDTIV